MREFLKSNNITYIGCEKIQISENENRLCYFYHRVLEVENVKKDLFVKRVSGWLNISNNLFNQEVDNPEYFIIRKSDYEMLVVFDNSLKIDGEKVISSKNVKVNEKVIRDFLYYLTYYYIKNEDFESATITLAKTGDIEAFTILNNIMSLEDKENAMMIIKERVSKENDSVDGKANIKTKHYEIEGLTLLEVLESIQKDEESMLLWDFSYPYERIGKEKKFLEDNIQFIKPNKGFGEVSRITIGDKKLNIGLRVKVNGQTVNLESELKHDSYIYKEYTIVLDGKINTKYIWCKLSQKLKKNFKSIKIIKNISNIFGEEIITLDISKLKIINESLINYIDKEELAKAIFDVEELECRLNIVRKLLKDLSAKGVEYNDGLTKAEKTRIEYRVDRNGLYHPLSVEVTKKNHYDNLYIGRILEWKIDKFPRKSVFNKWKTYYESALTINKGGREKLLEEKEELKKVLRQLSYKINLVRLNSVLNNKKIFIWDNEYEKDKNETDESLKMNLIIGGKVKVSTKAINDVTIRQDYYNVIEKS